MRPRPHPLFFRRKAGQKNLIFRTYSEFSCWHLWRENGLVFAVNKLCRFCSLVRENCSGASPSAFLSEKSGAKELKFLLGSEFVCLSLCRANHKTYVLFSLVRKKVPKKYAEGLRALSTPRDAVKLRLRFAPQVLRRYLNFHSMQKRKIRSFSLPLSDCGLTHSVF